MNCCTGSKMTKETPPVSSSRGGHELRLAALYRSAEGKPCSGRRGAVRGSKDATLVPPFKLSSPVQETAGCRSLSTSMLIHRASRNRTARGPCIGCRQHDGFVSKLARRASLVYRTVRVLRLRMDERRTQIATTFRYECSHDRSDFRSTDSRAACND